MDGRGAGPVSVDRRPLGVHTATGGDRVTHPRSASPIRARDSRETERRMGKSGEMEREWMEGGRNSGTGICNAELQCRHKPIPNIPSFTPNSSSMYET